MTRVLLVKTSSLGDVIHCLPAASDIALCVPGVELDWLVEESLAEIPRLHGAVAQVIAVKTRQWRKNPLAGETRREIAALRQQLRAKSYDRVIDAQGLIRTAWLARAAGRPVSGYDFRSVRERLASLLYAHKFPVSVTLHAAERMRNLAAQAMGYGLPEEADYGLTAQASRSAWLGEGRYLVALHATARPDKAWAEPNWVELGRRASDRDLTVVLPWGSASERERSEELASAIVGAVVPPKLRFTELAGLMAGAAVVVGVDTGLTHLASAVGAPVVAVYAASWAEFNGVIGPGFIVNLGKPGAPPDVDAVWTETQAALAHGRRTGAWKPAPPDPSSDLGKRRRFRP